MKKHWFLLLTLTLSFNALALVKRVYEAPIEKSEWALTKDSVLLCQIEHVIPRFGTAVFYQESGQEIKFKLISKFRYQKGLSVDFTTATASWKGQATIKTLTQVLTTGTNPVVKINDSFANDAYFELQNGLQIHLNFMNKDGFIFSSVVVSTVNFRDVEKKFSQCLTELHPYHFNDVKSSLVHFDFDEEFPKVEEEEASLRDMLQYLKVDHHVKSITVIGHTDYKGSICYNDTLSSRRALYIYDFLLQSNIDPKKLFLEFKGELKPLTKKKDEVSRAKNRRVEVLLEK